jgi:uncharacterized membrane protein
MNLLVSIMLVFIAIRIIPVFKWLFTMAGLLPMTLYQFASLSYDATTIGLSFLLISMILRLAFSEDIDIKRSVFWIFIISVLLATSKPPYFLIALSFLIIPVARLGSIRKYAIAFSGLILITLFISQMWTPVRRIAERFSSVPVQREYHTLFFPADNPFKKLAGFHHAMTGFMRMVPYLAAGGSLTGTYSDMNDESTSGDQNANEPVPGAAAGNPIDPGAQVKFILTNPVEYLGILTSTLKTSGNLYMVSLIGLFGWIDTQIPDMLAYINLIFLILLAMLLPAGRISLSLKQKSVLMAAFLISFILIETALYLYCNPVASSHIIAVQGRYFIAVVPLLLMVFYRTGSLSWPFQGKKSTLVKTKNQPTKSLKEPEKRNPEPGLVFILLPVFVLLLSLVNLLWSVYLIIDRFYVIYL